QSMIRWSMRISAWLLLAGMIGGATLMFGAIAGTPTVYPTGTTIYHPEKTWNGFTVFNTPENEGVIVIDMNGHEGKKWPGLSGVAGGPARVLPGGFVIAGSGNGAPHQEATALVQLDFAGNEVWRFDRAEQVKRSDGQTEWSGRQHHDWQRPTFAAGYFAPGVQPAVSNGPTLVLTPINIVNPEKSDRRLEDHRLLEVAWDGKILWEWKTSDHVGELGFDANARTVIRQAPGFNRARDSFDWLHINAAVYVGPNHWYDEGDQRFAPENIILSSRE